MPFGAMARLVDDQREHLQEVLSRGCILCFRTYQGGWKSVIKPFLRRRHRGDFEVMITGGSCWHGNVVGTPRRRRVAVPES